jgi:hypothetical protein
MSMLANFCRSPGDKDLEVQHKEEDFAREALNESRQLEGESGVRRDCKAA